MIFTSHSYLDLLQCSFLIEIGSGTLAAEFIQGENNENHLCNPIDAGINASVRNQSIA